MISIIIASEKKDLVDLESNIEETIGLPFEIIVIFNPKGQFGLSEAYNRGACSAKFSFLCFMHDDITFDSKNWGKIVIELLNNQVTGVLGIAGGLVKSKIPSDWIGGTQFKEVHLVQHFKYSQIPPCTIKQSYSGKNPAPVLLLDGVWLCVKKSVFNQFKFDEINFNKFHGYDLDFTFQVSQKFLNYVTFDIKINHFSEGNYSLDWIESATNFVKKWVFKLPRAIIELPKDQWNKIEKKNLKHLIKHLYKLNFRPIQIEEKLKEMEIPIDIKVRLIITRYFFKKFILSSFSFKK